MRKLITPFLVIGMLIACNSNKETENIKDTSAITENEIVDSTSINKNSNHIKIDSDEALIATALMAAPAESRAESTVIGYNMAGEFVTLKEGTNEYICLADDPKRDGFSAACYHKSLEPFMARGRALKEEGKSGAEIFDIRESEAKSGQLKMGDTGSTLHIYYGPSTMYDPETTEVEDAHYRYVVYIPWATSESTGLPEKPLASNHPWIMNPGTHRAHIMISPKAEKKD